jgi:glycosyltransferase involved in cell wall biosynthesis
MDTEIIIHIKQLHEAEEENEYMGKNKPVNLCRPIVSICVATYQHGNYIKECIDGILMQQTTFSYEIIVGEDESQDGTREICIEYARKYPDKIRLYLRNRETSIYYENSKSVMRLNGIWCRMSARGKYIALCEGDDYWTDPLKLQKQVDFLDAHPDYILTCGGFRSRYMEETKVTIEHGIVSKEQESPRGFTFLLKDASKAWFTKTLTAMFRNEKDIIDTVERYRYGKDVHLFYHLLKNGKGYYFKEVFGIYNIHEGGIFSLKPEAYKLVSSYYVFQELYSVNHDEYSRVMYLELCLRIINYKLSLLMKHPGPNIFKLLMQSVGLMKTRNDIILVIKSFIPEQIKRWRHLNSKSHLQYMIFLSSVLVSFCNSPI